jgi:hypothetical protein
MKSILPGLVALGLLGAWAASQPPAPATPLPTPFPEARYQQMTAKSPFAVASASAEATAAPTPGFAAQLYVTGVARVGDKDFVAIKTRDPQEGKPAVQFLEVGGTTEEGIKVESVKWSDETGKSTVDVSKAGERATLAFDEDTIKAGAGNGPMPGQPGGIRLPVMPGVRPIGFPVNPAFQQQGAQFNRRIFQQPQMNGVPGFPNVPGGVDVRRRRLPIQSGQ